MEKVRLTDRCGRYTMMQLGQVTRVGEMHMEVRPSRPLAITNMHPSASTCFAIANSCVLLLPGLELKGVRPAYLVVLSPFV